ncbi:MAG: choice-of-anchor D domain-containing protein [Burkholderiaceae bacterium]
MRATTIFAAIVLAGSAFAMPASAADPVRGKALYQTDAPVTACSGCHGTDPTRNDKKILNGRDPQVILNAIASNTGGMGFYKGLVTSVDAADIAAYLTNPAAGTPMPVASLSSSTLAFGNQVLQTSSASMTATLTNSGTASLVLSSVTLGGTNPGDFTRSGTCATAVTLAPAQTCTVSAVFKPSAIGARSATVTIAHNASPATSVVTLTGTGMSAPTPAAGLTATTLSFGNQVVGTTSAAKPVTISNTGSATLILGTIALTGSNPADFAAANCNGASLAPGATCTISVTFNPAAPNARSATLGIPSNAAGSPHNVALTGTGAAAPAPGVTLNPAALAFGNQATGTTSAAKSIALTNSGSATLGITAITSTGTGFGMTHNCPASLAASASCTISVTFAPATSASFSGAVTIASTAVGSPHSATFTGTGVAPTPTAPVASLSPLAVDFGMLPLNTTSPAKTVTLSNTGNAPLSIADLKLGGTNAADFAQTHNCPVGSSLAAGSACSISVRFIATATGPRSATVVLTSNAAGSPSADLKGTGVVQSAALAQVAPTAIVFGNTRLGRSSSERTVRVRNSGTTPLEISSAATTGDFTFKSECPTTLAPGKSCEFKVRFKPTVLGMRTGEFTLASNAAGSPHAVKLSGQAIATGGRDDDCDDDESKCSQSVLPFFGKSR